MTQGKLHELKTWPNFFQAIDLGYKKFELRKNDRDFKTGDILRLKEYDPIKEAFTGCFIDAVVGYVLKGPSDFGLKDGYVIMSIKPLWKGTDLNANMIYENIE
jgi:hypothetical protein